MKIKVFDPSKHEAADAAEAETKAETEADAVESPAVAEAPSEAKTPAVEQAAETNPPGGETLPVASETPDAPAETKPAPEPTIQPPAKLDYVVAHESRLEMLKDEFVCAAQRRSDLEADLKAAKLEEKNALKLYTETLLRGPQKPFSPAAPNVVKGDTATTPGGHVLYKKGDADAPDNIKDANGDIALAMCRVCGNAESGLSDPCSPPTTDANVTQSDAWRSASINELSTLSEKLREKLIEAGADTMGTLEDLRGQIADGKANWPKGIGAAKITQIEDAVIDWLTKNRDYFAFSTTGGAASTPSDSPESLDTTNNTPNEATEDWINTETWAMMPAAEKSAYLTARVRAIRGDDGNPEWAKPAVEGANYFDDGEQEFWATKAAGVEPPTLENFIATAACPWHPCDAQDDWLRGFASAFDVWAAEKETLGEDEAEGEGEGDGDTEANEPVAVAAVPQTAKGWESF